MKLKKKFSSYEKSFKGIDSKIVCNFFIENYISELCNNIKQAGMLFKKENEDRSIAKHIKQRRKFIFHVRKLIEVFGFFNRKIYKPHYSGNNFFLVLDKKY